MSIIYLPCYVYLYDYSLIKVSSYVVYHQWHMHDMHVIFVLIIAKNTLQYAVTMKRRYVIICNMKQLMRKVTLT